MAQSKPPLLKLPLEILNEITKDFDLRTVCILRKTCRQLRQYVDNDNVPLDLKLSILDCYESISNSINLRFGEQSSFIFEILYEKCIGGCNITYKQTDSRRTIFLENADFGTVAGNDLGLILKHQKSELRTLVMSGMGIRIIGENGLEPAIGRMLISLKAHLETQKVSIRDIDLRNFDEEHVMKVVPHLNQNSLRSIRLRNSKPVDMARIVNTEQWKACRRFLSGMVCNTQLINFHHLEDPSFEVDQVSSNELFLLKETKLLEPSFCEFKFKYKQLSDPSNLKKLLGQPHPVKIHGYERWFYRIPNNSHMILVLKRQARNHEVILYSVDIDSIPDDAFL